MLPARLRRLSNSEFKAAAEALLGGPVDLGDRLPPDVRQSGYTQNAEQTLTASLGTRVASLTFDLASDAVKAREKSLMPCAAAKPGCIDDTISSLGTQAFRRPLSDAEARSLRELYGKAASDPKSGGGLVWVLSALLQAPSLWYLSEGQGEPTSPGVVQLDPYEIASSLAFTVTGAPPDGHLLGLAEGDAEGNTLADPRVRAREARRLLSRSETRHHFRRFVLEWLEVDTLMHTAKDDQLHPTYDAVKGAMLQETMAFVDEVMVHEGASLRGLLTAGFTAVDPIMARYYGFRSYGPRVSLAAHQRIGVLQHASFLSVHAHEDSSSPVKRGDFVLRQVLCDATPRPKELDLEVSIPPADPAHTTRERFARHANDPNCAFCHQKIDGFGFTFEDFDAAGRLRTKDNEKPVHSQTRFSIEGEQLGFANSVQLSRWLALDPRSKQCFAKNAFRFFSAQSDPATEEAYLQVLDSLPPTARDSLVEAVVAFVSSDLFLLRRAETNEPN